MCIDVVPWMRIARARPYGMDDLFADIYEGRLDGSPAKGLGRGGYALVNWRGLDGYSAALLFPVLESDLPGEVLNWMIARVVAPSGSLVEGGRLSADELMVRLRRTVVRPAGVLRRENYKMLERNHEKSVFYQLDLSDVAEEYSRMELDAPEVLPEGGRAAADA